MLLWENTKNNMIYDVNTLYPEITDINLLTETNSIIDYLDTAEEETAFKGCGFFTRGATGAGVGAATTSSVPSPP